MRCSGVASHFSLITKMDRYTDSYFAAGLKSFLRQMLCCMRTIRSLDERKGVLLHVYTERWRGAWSRLSARCQYIVPCPALVPWDAQLRKQEVAGALEGSKRSVMEGFGKSCLTNLFFYVWFLAGSPENSFLIISLTVKWKRKKR